jgi:protein O-mannosyl-transferase
MSHRSRSKERSIEAAAPRDPPVAGQGGGPASAHPWAAPGWLPLLALMAATLLVYQRMWHAGFVWDDDAHVIRPELHTPGGLWRIWFEPGATQQYYPVLYSAFWLELRLWGYSAQGYHVANLLLHGTAACLLYRVLRRLRLPGAFLGACAFAIHPVCVESVAWISEQKNTLSGVFYLAAALAYLRFDERRKAAWYAVGIVLFGLAVLSKSVTATLPAALLVVLWWKRGSISWRRDVAPLAPWLAMGAAAGTATAWMERTHVGAGGAAFALGAAERLLVAGRAIWFYLGKVFWPADLVFIYPRWTLDPGSLWQDICPVAVVAALAVLFWLRRSSRGPLAAALLFVGTLFPALGFVNVYPFRFSFVADHFEYLAAAVMLSASAAGLALAAGRLSRRMRLAAVAAASCAVAALAALTWRQSSEYSDIETLWQATIAGNPGCWLAHNNLGLALMAEGRTDEAVRHYQKAIEIYPGFAGAHNNLGIALMKRGQPDEAVAQYRSAIDLEPGDAETHNNLAMALRAKGRLDEAIDQYGVALEIRPDDLATNFNLANALLQEGRIPEAIARYERALQISPDFADAHNNLGNALRRLGRLDEAIGQYRKALAIDPANARALRNLNSAVSSTGN